LFLLLGVVDPCVKQIPKNKLILIKQKFIQIRRTSLNHRIGTVLKSPTIPQYDFQNIPNFGVFRPEVTLLSLIRQTTQEYRVNLSFMTVSRTRKLSLVA
jgi:hypothetical protein